MKIPNINQVFQSPTKRVNTSKATIQILGPTTATTSFNPLQSGSTLQKIKFKIPQNLRGRDVSIPYKAGQHFKIQ